NGNGQTAWYQDPDGAPIHYGTSFVPPLHLFNVPSGGTPAEQTLYVANINGGRPSVMKEIILITNPAPMAEKISLSCDPDQDCSICEGQDVLLQVGLYESYGQTFEVNLINENSDYQIEVSGDGFHPVNLPAADRYQIQSVSNQFGCAASEGFGNTDVSIDIRSPAIGYLPLLPDLCKEDVPYVLPEMPGGIPGVWTMEGEYLTSVNPATLDVGWTTLDFEPTDECAETQSTDIEILPVPVTDFDLPTIPCADKYYQPVMDPATSSGGTWTIDPAVAIDPATGGVYLADLVQGQTYTWIYTISGQCTSSSSGFIEVPECPCEIEIVHETQCGDNGSPADPSDDIFEIDLIASGSNTSSEWVSDDRNWSGQYGNWYDLGPFPINNGPVHLSIHDSEDLTCLTAV